MINPRLAAVVSPPIPQARSWAARYDGRAGPLVDLTQAVPGYPPHPELVGRLAAAAAEPAAYAYGPIAGDLAVREAYAAELSADAGVAISPEDVAVTAGGNMGSFAATLLLAEAGAAIALPAPWYFNHRMNADMLGVAVVPLPCRPERGFAPDPAEAERLLTDRVRVMILVTPNNPTGASYPPETLDAFADLCRRRGIVLVVDETYRDFRPAGAGRPHELFARPDWRDHVIQIQSFSKSYCVPGFRAGAIVAGPRFMPDLVKILDCLQICAPRVTQAGLGWAIPNLRSWREDNRATMNDRADRAKRSFTRGGWRPDSTGAYFAYLRHPFPDVSSWAVAEALATRLGILTLPGASFGPGQDGHLRLAFANVEAAIIGDVAARLDGFALP